MDIEKYNYKAGNMYLEYEFFSEGPKGKILKVVRYSKIEQQGTVFNLGFGDKNEETGFVDDFVISNNSDREKVLATVASTALKFISQYPAYSIFAKGRTPSRTRLYQMGISMNLEELNKRFYIYGMVNNEWELFNKNVNYEAFLVELR